VFGGLATEQRATGVPAPVRDTRADLGHLVRADLATGDVVEQEQRLGPARDQVVHDHRDQVDADGVMDVELLGDDQLRAHPVGGGGEDRVPVLAHIEPEQAGEATEAAQHLRAGGPLDLGLEQFDRPLPGVDGDPGLRVRHHAFAGGPARSGRPGPAVAARRAGATNCSAT
jgi:hypothetical protein